MANTLHIKEKIDVLMQEKEVARQELLQNVKIMFTSLYSFLVVFAAILGFYYGKNAVNNSLNNVYILFLVEQIEFIVLLMNVSINSNVMSLAGYCAALEEKINALCEEEIVFWESVVVKKHLAKLSSVQMSSTIILNCVYVAFMIFLGIVIQNNRDGYTCSIVLALEIALLIFLALSAIRERNKSYNLSIKNIKR